MIIEVLVVVQALVAATVHDTQISVTVLTEQLRVLETEAVTSVSSTSQPSMVPQVDRTWDAVVTVTVIDTETSIDVVVAQIVPV